jgi:hypothetical protein
MLYVMTRDVLPLIRAKTPGTKIFVIGGVLEWGDSLGGKKGSLLLSMFHYWRKYGVLPPEYMKFGLSPTVHPEDSDAIRKIEGLGVTYLSSYKALCNAEGCLTRVGPLPTDLTAVDHGHLSKAGATYLIHNLADRIFREE